METIQRKSLLYKSGVGVTCINHVMGCSHGCRYPCYAWMMAQSYNRVSGYDEWCRPKLVENAAEILKKELSGKKKRPESVHLCLSTDPFMTGYPEVAEMTLKLIAIINTFGIRCSLLTKGILPAELTDSHRFSGDNLYGISLISLDETFRRRWEPGASPYAERIAALKYLHDHGLKTRVHIEPYPTPNLIRQDIMDLLEQVNFAGHIWFGGWNYNDMIRQHTNYQTFYREMASHVVQYCRKHGLEYGT